MSFRIKTEPELRGSLGNRTFSVGRETREKMVKQLFQHAKMGFGQEAGKRHLVIGQTPETGKHLHFQMHDERAGGLDELDMARLGEEFFGEKHDDQLMMSKGEMAEGLRKKIDGLSKGDAKRLIETLVNEIHGEKSYKGEEKKKMQEAKNKGREAKEKAMNRVIQAKKELGKKLGERNFGVIPKRLPFEPRKLEKRMGEHGEVLENEKTRRGGIPNHEPSDPRDMIRGARPEPERGREEGHIVFRDLHLH